MELIYKVRDNKNILLCSSILLFTTYFIYHTISGNLGYISLLELKNKYDELQFKYEDIKAERMLIEHKVNNMNPNSLDLDLSEQQIKEVLGLADPNEQIIMIKKRP